MEKKSLLNILSERNKSLEFRDIDAYGLDLQKVKSELDRYKKDTENRDKLTSWVKWVVSIYLIIVCFILCVNSRCLCLSDVVICTLLGTTTFNILGLMYIVLKGYFNVNK